MLTNSSLPIVPVANDATSYYVSLQAISSGKSTSDFVSQALKYNSQTNHLCQTKFDSKINFIIICI